MPPTVILFDVDGVLVQPQGYKEALRATVRHFAARMGQPHITIDDETIASFEALGVTNEWESAPFCVATLLNQALRQQPALNSSDLPTTLDNIARTRLNLTSPVFAAEARTALQDWSEGRASHAFLRHFKTHSATAHHPLWEALLVDVYDFRAPTTTVFQAHTLGVERYQQTYQQAPPLALDSYLLTYDTPLLSGQQRQTLLARQEAGEVTLAIFTARPSLPPAGAEVDPTGYPPEADLAAQLLDWSDQPLIAAGRLAWLSARRGKSPSDYIKPSPVHALAGIAAALGTPEPDALLVAARLAEEGHLDPPFADLTGQPLQLVVFEDSTGGIQATRQAADLLQAAGIPARYIAVGVAQEAVKQTALRAAGAQVVPDVSTGLDWLWEALKR